MQHRSSARRHDMIATVAPSRSTNSTGPTPAVLGRLSALRVWRRSGGIGSADSHLSQRPKTGVRSCERGRRHSTPGSSLVNGVGDPTLAFSTRQSI